MFMLEPCLLKPCVHVAGGWKLSSSGAGALVTARVPYIIIYIILPVDRIEAEIISCYGISPGRCIMPCHPVGVHRLILHAMNSDRDALYVTTTLHYRTVSCYLGYPVSCIVVTVLVSVTLCWLGLQCVISQANWVRFCCIEYNVESDQVIPYDITPTLHDWT